MSAPTVTADRARTGTGARSPLASVPLDDRYAARVYAGLVGKTLGVYLGRPVEGWPYADIADRLGQLDDFANEQLGVPLIVADDDLSGTLCFGRAVQDTPGRDLTAADVGRTWLNYVIEDTTILWWGGYGRSTEHTAYLNLRAGLVPPESGSIARNGSTLAEQIGAQIFSDAFALLCPGDPATAVRWTRAAASVSHDGVALDCASFFAVLRAAAFVEADLGALIALGRSWVDDPRLLELIDRVVERCAGATDWRAARDWIDDAYGYARYPGPCHALSNTALALGALLLGGDDLGRSIMIAASAGFDTDSNAGTVGCVNGVRLGLAGLDPVAHLRGPVADRLLIVSADGGECVTDVARETWRLVDTARARRGLEVAARPRFDFGLPGAVHGFTACPHRSGPTAPAALGYDAGSAALRVAVPAGTTRWLSTPTFLDPLDAVTNFSTLASPTLYPGDVVTFALVTDRACVVRPYVLIDTATGIVVADGEPVALEPGRGSLDWEVPARGNDVPFRLGLQVLADTDDAHLGVHAVDWAGAPRTFGQSGLLQASIWDTRPRGLAPWVSSAKNFEADFGATYCVSHPGSLGVVTTGTRAWLDYTVSTRLTLSLHATAGLVVRARGHRRFSAAVVVGDQLQLIDQVDDERVVLATTPFAVALDRPYEVTLACRGDRLAVSVDGAELLSAHTGRLDGGGAGFLVERGTFTADGFTVTRVPTPDSLFPTDPSLRQRESAPPKGTS